MAGRPLEIEDEEEVNGRYAICNAELSKIVSFDSVHRSVSDRTPYTLLRPVSPSQHISNVRKLRRGGHSRYSSQVESAFSKVCIRLSPR